MADVERETVRKSGTNRERHVEKYIFGGIAVAFVAMASVQFPMTRQQGSGSWHPGHGNRVDNQVESQEDRFILSIAGVLDTRTAEGLSDRDSTESSQRFQWYVQTVPYLTAAQRRELETDAGLALGEYIPNNAFLVLGTTAEAAQFGRARHVVWVGKRPTQHKVDPVLSEKSIRELQRNGTLSWMKLDLFFFPTTQARASQIATYHEYLEVSKRHMSEVLEIRAVGSEKIVLEMPVRDVRRTVAWLSTQEEILWIGRREVYSTRNYDSNKIITLGGSERARYRRHNVLLEQNGLDGRGQMIAVSDTGLDFDHCMLWQQSFPFPCYDYFDQSAFNPLCPASAYAALIGNPDFHAFVKSMLTTTVDIPLLHGGRASGASFVFPPLHQTISLVSREDRQAAGWIFGLGGDPHIHTLLAAWSDVRDDLLTQLTDSSSCESCGGEVEFVNGTTIFVPENSYFFDKADSTPAKAVEAIGFDRWWMLQSLMFEKCMCFFSVPSQATVDPLESWKGVIPPIRELQNLAVTPTAAITRKAAGQTALPYELLEELCNASRLRPLPEEEVRAMEPEERQERMCEQSVRFAWAGETVVWNVCNLTWDARGLETSIAKCFSAEYLREPRQVPRGEETTSEDRSQQYTYSTTQAWWAEYTRVPPFNAVDLSRRVVNAYFAVDSCEACGMCARLRLDSRTYPGMQTSDLMPARVARGGMLTVYLAPDEKDWRFDSFEAATVGFHLLLTVTAVVDVQPNRPVASIDGAMVCLMTNQAYVEAPDGGLEAATYWREHCLNAGSAPRAEQPAESESVFAPQLQVDAEFETAEFRFFEEMPLQPSADGWRLLMLNNETRVAGGILFSAVMQLYTTAVGCSDKRDGEAIFAENTHGIGLDSTHVSSAGEEEECELEGLTYCDASTTSGRQLDECFICGGSCFQPKCSPELCLEHNPDMVRVRYFGEFPTGEVSKAFIFDELSQPNQACPSPTSPEVSCQGLDCNAFNECRGREERYKIDTHFLEVQAGVPHAFRKGDLNLEYVENKMVGLSVRVLERPDLLLRQGIMLDGTGAGSAAIAPPPGSEYYRQEKILFVNGTNFTRSALTEDVLEVTGNLSDVGKVLQGLAVTVPSWAGTSRTNRQFLLRIQLSELMEDGSQFRYPNLVNEAAVVECPHAQPCVCVQGYAGEACDHLDRPLDIWITARPRETGQRVLPSLKSNGGRRPTLNRDGHGTHVVTSIVGKTDDSEVQDEGTARMKAFDAMAHGAFLSFIDIGESGNPYLTPPESLGAGLMGPAYQQAGARVMLHPWNCEDVSWWRKQDEAFSHEQRVAGDETLNQQASICNRYTTGTWEVDSFIATNPDLTVIFPAGNNGRSGDATVSAPGTCKNCITVGMTQSWPEEMREAVNFSLTQCRPEDCPQDVDKTATCASVSKLKPEALPSCCRSKYVEGLYSPDHVDLPSGRGPTVSRQAPYSQTMGDPFAEVEELLLRRVKPDVVAPGLNIVSGRSDGDASSGGTYGCRCCYSPEGETDRSALMTMSGSSQAAAKVAAAAAVIRQYFADGYFPSGNFELAPAHSASAALVKAVLVASADVMAAAARERGQLQDLSLEVGPNAVSGFGRVNLANVLRMGRGLDPPVPRTMAAGERCECTGNNSAILDAHPEWFEQRAFPQDYGAACAAWHADACDVMFPDNPAARPAPSEVETYDLSCCMAWCFVDRSCPTAIQWDASPSLYYSFRTCEQPAEVILEPHKCAFADANVRTIAKDHSVDRLRPDVDPPTFAESAEPLSGAIVQGESVAYITYVMQATPQRPLVVAMAYTDPPSPLGAATVCVCPIITVLVNDLDLEVIVTPVQLAAGESLQNSSRTVEKELTVVYKGNEVAGGDRYNNVERVTAIKIDRPSKVEAKVTAVRVVAPAQPGGGPGVCQTFALVITGNLEEEATIDPTQVVTEPSPLTAGVCGRAERVVVEEERGVVVWLLAVVIAGSILCCVVLICLTCRHVTKRAARLAHKYEDGARPEQVGYLSRVQKVEKEVGVARGGGPDFIILGENASDMDDFYCGLPVLITEGAGEHEQATITAYEGRTRRAAAQFDMGPSAGSAYAISHPSAAPMGYKVGEAGYIPVGDLPGPEEGPPIYAKQVRGLTGAREKFGRFTEKGLASMGIGRPKRVWSKKEEVQAVHAGIQVGKPVTSEDLYEFAMRSQTEEAERARENSRLKDTPQQAQLKQDYYNSVERIKMQQTGSHTNKEGLKGRNMIRKLTGTAINDAPPLKSLGGKREQGARGYLKETELEPAIISAQAGGISLQTWEMEEAAPPNGHANGNGNGHGHAGGESPERPTPEEPRSGTKEEFEMVSATVQYAKRSPNGNGAPDTSPVTPRDNGEKGAGIGGVTPRQVAGTPGATPRTVGSGAKMKSPGGSGAKLTPAQKAKLIDDAFGAKAKAKQTP